ncbi:MAG TPA: hypothetical protein VFR84_15525 [Candidatus Angelobacter sp.]|nr:hypothetical protein [Candidatus Angelobacter sp.]
MNCQQFQEVLPYIIESGGKPEEEEHLKTCPACSALVEDLQYIAAQAKLLLPMRDPSPRVWSNIEASLHREGLLPTEGRMSRLGHITKTSTQTKSWTPLGWAMALTATIVFAVVLINYKPHQLPSGQLSAQNTSEPSSLSMSSDDQQLVSQLAQADPGARGAYENSLREVNAYISDAQAAAQRDPDDADAQELLLDAYQQKEMLYQMAIARSLP